MQIGVALPSAEHSFRADPFERLQAIVAGYDHVTDAQVFDGLLAPFCQNLRAGCEAHNKIGIIHLPNVIAR